MTEVSGNLHLTIAAYSLQPSNLALLYTLVISAGNSFNVPPDRTQSLTNSKSITLFITQGIHSVKNYFKNIIEMPRSRFHIFWAYCS
jgi:hypothetical protein